MSPRRRGARSIRGALGTYLWVSAGLVVVLALVLAFGPDGQPELVRVELHADTPWQGVTLDRGDGGSGWALAPGEAVEVPPGSWRLTIFERDGVSHRWPVELSGEQLLIGDAASLGMLDPPPEPGAGEPR